MRGQESQHLHGVVSRAELLAAGVGSRAIEHRVKTGRLFAKYRGVYAVGRADLTVWGERRAIVLACGSGAVLSHRSAAGAWGLRPDGRPRWEVIVPSARTPTAPVDTHEHRLWGFERTTLEGVAITTPMRTVLDLSSVIAVHQLRRAIERAVELELFDLAALERVMAAHPRWPGTPVLRALLADFRTHGLTRTRSDLEAAFLQLCLDHGLPRPTINRSNNGREVDATWPGSDLIVEIDSWQHHRHRRAFAIDRAKDRAALRAGRRTARFTGDEIEQAPAQVAAELRALI
jgi:very-short-patch-repair endonuclease